jgi:eukaryotic-like serine/threonine-protein kinase
MPIPTAEERIGTLLDGKYRLVRIVARGGMAVLYEGRHDWTQRKVAIKLLRTVDEPEITRAQRFIIEARAAASLEHPNVVDILDMGEDAGALYVAMEFLEGMSLEAILQESRRLTPETTLEYLLPILGALAAAHDAGIIHRDLKPANIFICRDAAGQPVPKLLDFGIAKVWQDVDLTHDGLVVGTPQYMSPEQALGDQVSPATDVWAAGVVIYRCLSGQLPFSGRDARSVLAAVHRGTPRPLSELDPSLPPRFCAAIERALSRDLAQRYPDMHALDRALRATASAESIRVSDSPAPLEPTTSTTSWATQSEEGAPTAATPERPLFRLGGLPRKLAPAGLAAVLGAVAVAVLAASRSATDHGELTSKIEAVPPATAVAPPRRGPEPLRAATPVPPPREEPPNARPNQNVARRSAPRIERSPVRIKTKEPLGQRPSAVAATSDSGGAAAPGGAIPAIRTEW